LEQLADPDTAESEKILRTCTHCGFCTATCPTYVLLGDELDSPRGRIYLIKDMIASGEKVTADTVKHIDRCLSCLSCMTTCPSGVNYMHLVDHARRWIERNYRRAWSERWLRLFLAAVLARPSLFRLSLWFAAILKPWAGLLPVRFAPLLALAPVSVAPASPTDRPRIYGPAGERRMRVALLSGCAQKALAPEINEATIRLLTRHGGEVVVAQGGGCCGSLAHHLGQERQALGLACANIDEWERERSASGLDAIVINASGCGTTVKDYGFMLRSEPAYAENAARVAGLARDDRGMRRSGYVSRQRRLPSPNEGSPIMRLARCSMGNASTSGRKSFLPPGGSRRSMCRRGISVAARQGPIIYCSRKLQPHCATASSRILPRAGQISSRPAISAASLSSPLVAAYR
jgi:glycolate oxidase iron-sulfur subunit